MATPEKTSLPWWVQFIWLTIATVGAGFGPFLLAPRVAGPLVVLGFGAYGVLHLLERQWTLPAVFAACVVIQLGAWVIFGEGFMAVYQPIGAWYKYHKAIEADFLGAFQVYFEIPAIGIVLYASALAIIVRSITAAICLPVRSVRVVTCLISICPIVGAFAGLLILTRLAAR